MQAYAHIVERGDSERGLDKFIIRLPSVLGRTSVSDSPSEDQVCISSTEPTLSRHHARIQWNEQESKLELLCISKNGMVVNNKTYSSDDPPVLLSHKSTVRMGSVKFYIIAGNIKVDPTSRKPLPALFEMAAPKKDDTNSGKKTYLGTAFYCILSLISTN